ncbi:hypothetical protein HanRHA438_Chr04g0178111 [Helianthus annuus]|nr:hypothetical protein HanRHA438_Chr04g0178111 [Helianthus annuus]
MSSVPFGTEPVPVTVPKIPKSGYRYRKSTQFRNFGTGTGNDLLNIPSRIHQLKVPIRDELGTIRYRTGTGTSTENPQKWVPVPKKYSVQ